MKEVGSTARVPFASTYTSPQQFAWATPPKPTDGLTTFTRSILPTPTTSSISWRIACSVRTTKSTTRYFSAGVLRYRQGHAA